jgi:hypothetical protein
MMRMTESPFVSIRRRFSSTSRFLLGGELARAGREARILTGSSV